MFFSKSFGYALRGILYIALASKEKPRIRVDEIARELMVPKPFLSKIMKKAVKGGMLSSTKGPHGGFSLNQTTLSTSLMSLVVITDGKAQFEDCALRLKKCNSANPCPLHNNIQGLRNELMQVFTQTKIGDLLDADYPNFIKSISV